MGTFEDKYLDVLQNIEFGIVQVYRRHPDMLDWHALNAVNAAMRAYQAEARQQPAPKAQLNPIEQETLAAIQGMCNWRLGRETLYDDKQQPLDLPMAHITLEEVMACLKRIRRSIEKWNKHGGRQGYLTFVSDFFPATPEG
jgi:hypothetical protein